jgi:hypothetical protein
LYGKRNGEVFMGKLKSAVISLFLIAGVGLLACFALGLFDGDGVTKVRERDYSEFTFTGNLRNGRFTGNGSMFFQDGARYSGGFSAGRFSGNGTLYDTDGIWNFSGVFQDGQANGGTFYPYGGENTTYERGETADILTGYRWKYEGGINESGQFGTGTFTFADGSVYTGGFSNGLAEGEGIYTDAPGRTVYAGGFKAGLFDGHGKYFSPEGWVYEGGFKEGLFDGEGVLVYDTETVGGVWEKGVQVLRHE